jgi:hypothetical protein
MDLLKRIRPLLSSVPSFGEQQYTAVSINKVSSNYWRAYICKQVSCSNNYQLTIAIVITQPLFLHVLNSGGHSFPEILYENKQQQHENSYKLIVS